LALENIGSWPRLRKLARSLVVAALVIAVTLATPSAALAQKKKKKEEAPPTKSYVLPYFIVLMLTAVGLMTVCRPSSRKDRVDEKKKEEE
jgi:hypothetical protein